MSAERAESSERGRESLFSLPPHHSHASPLPLPPPPIPNPAHAQVNAATMKMLKLVEPYLAFGAPNLKTVRELVLKRGFGKVNGSRIPLTDNAIVEAALGKHGLVCVEDLVHELYTAGPAFKQASNFLWPFKLSAPKGGLSKKRLHYVEGGFHGSHEHKINALVRRMN
jgi:large subunit ribosomal protein L7e